MKEKQRALRAKSHLRARDEGGGKRGSQYLFHFVYSGSLFQKFPILSIQRFIPSQQFYPLLVKIPENLSAQQKLFRSNNVYNHQQLTTKLIEIRMVTILKWKS